MSKIAWEFIDCINQVILSKDIKNKSLCLLNFFSFSNFVCLLYWLLFYYCDKTPWLRQFEEKLMWLAIPEDYNLVIAEFMKWTSEN